MLIIILTLLLLGLLVPVGGDVGYCEGDLRVLLRIGALTICLYPRKEEKRRKKNVLKSSESGTEQQPSKKSIPDVSKDEVLDAISVVVKSVKKLCFHLHRLKLHFISAFDDPYQTAMVFGYANGFVNAFGLQHLEQADVQIGVDFEREKFYFDGYLSVTIRIYYICKLICCLIGGAIPILLRRRKRLKTKECSSAAQGKEA